MELCLVLKRSAELGTRIKERVITGDFAGEFGYFDVRCKFLIDSLSKFDDRRLQNDGSPLNENG